MQNAAAKGLLRFNRRHMLAMAAAGALSPRAASSSVSGPLPYHGRAMLALRPAWASWIAGRAP